jgi:23S rRNA-/tRNA-specific pseudouridylate synthase
MFFYRVDPEYIVREGDVITRLAHVHESPVLDEEVGIVHEDDQLVVVDKPASWPVHSCGNYRLNSLVYILARDLGYRDLRPIHRLDKVRMEGQYTVLPVVYYTFWSVIWATGMCGLFTD